MNRDPLKILHFTKVKKGYKGLKSFFEVIYISKFSKKNGFLLVLK